MNRMSRLVLVVATALALLVVPMAGARPAEDPQAAHHRAEGGWFGAALKWLEDLAGFRRPAPGRHARSTSPTATQKDGGGAGTTGGSCIDPAGNPRPWCA